MSTEYIVREDDNKMIFDEKIPELLKEKLKNSKILLLFCKTQKITS